MTLAQPYNRGDRQADCCNSLYSLFIMVSQHGHIRMKYNKQCDSSNRRLSNLSQVSAAYMHGTVTWRESERAYVRVCSEPTNLDPSGNVCSTDVIRYSESEADKESLTFSSLRRQWLLLFVIFDQFRFRTKTGRIS